MTIMTEKKHNNHRATFRVSQKAVVYNPTEEKYLLVKSTKDGSPTHRQWYKTFGPWDLPGGHIDVGERDMKDALLRELKEEMGVALKRDDLLGPTGTVLQEHPGNPVPVVVIFYLVEYSGEIVLSEEHVEHLWLTYDEVIAKKDVKPWVKDALTEAKAFVENCDAGEHMLRVLAEFDNYKKRSAQQQKDFAKYASEKVIMEMLPVLDNFHAATQHVPEDQKDSPWLTGIMYIQKQMEKVFEDAGVTRLPIKEGDAFDPETMEAIKSDKADDKKQHAENESHDQKEKAEKKHRITKVVQHGYKIGDKVLRPARVEVCEQ